ncbi:peroxisomal-coenzyme A synthetase [Leucosporidium creatinivorum]|uniref:Peroxisomal-coenzyme A synthetase n=1 Tax=Leucosporidium creatinivorum TaxID=106004 RepID=A0A1Y2CA81_9BASI|nr:peroxisomal-coenzyme A synthetase [Leucosporidium creatinivorum]
MATLLKPFTQPSSSPALLLPASASLGPLSLSYSNLTHLIHSLRDQLDKWEGPNGPLNQGDVVSISLGNGIEFALSFLGVGAHRCIAAPLNPSYNSTEVSFYLQDCSTSLLLVPSSALTSSPLHPAVQAARELNVPVAEVRFDGKEVVLEFESGRMGRGGNVVGSGEPREDDVALVLHTSGTTGRPKAVPLSHLNLATTMKNIVNTYSLTPKDRTFLVMPLFHVHGLLAGFLAPLLSGGSVVIPPKFSAGSFWDEFVGSGANWYTAVPTIHQILLRTPKPNPIPTIRFIRSCSSALAPATFAELEKVFKAPVVEAYAMTEAAHQMTSNPLPPLTRKPGTVGLGQGVSIRILSLTSDEQVSEGEVAIKGANVTKGYINNDKANQESFTKDGYFRTGDRGRLDEEGYLVLTGRLKELINRGGEKISPLEVDAALLSVEGVGEAVAFGVADEKFGEKVWAAVVLKKGSSIDEQTIIKQCKSKISAFKCPEKVFILDAIPKTATGKIQRKALATKFAKEVEQSNGFKAKL